MPEIHVCFCDNCNEEKEIHVGKRGQGFFYGTLYEAFLAKGWLYDPKTKRLICNECYAKNLTDDEHPSKV